jgi:hypothetical protein
MGSGSGGVVGVVGGVVEDEVGNEERAAGSGKRLSPIRHRYTDTVLSLQIPWHRASTDNKSAEHLSI